MSKYILRQRPETNDEDAARNAVKPGMILYGYCCGFFGRDSYEDKVVLEIVGNYIKVKGCDTSYINFGKIDSWVDLVNFSNSALSEMEFEESERK